MKIVIDIPDEDYKRIKDMPDAFNSLTSRAYKSIKNGTPLPKGHGRLIEADEVSKGKFHFECECDCAVCSHSRNCECDLINSIPTVIEADKEGQDETK